MNQTHNGLDAGAVPLRFHAVGAANTQTVVNMPAVPGWVNVITGYDYTGTGATVGAVVDITVSAMFNRKMAVPASPLLVASDSWRAPHGIAAAAPNTVITVTVNALGAGNLGGNLAVYGYRVKG